MSIHITRPTSSHTDTRPDHLRDNPHVPGCCSAIDAGAIWCVDTTAGSMRAAASETHTDDRRRHRVTIHRTSQTRHRVYYYSGSITVMFTSYSELPLILYQCPSITITQASITVTICPSAVFLCFWSARFVRPCFCVSVFLVCPVRPSVRPSVFLYSVL